MPKVKVYNTEGKVVGEKELSAAVFGVAINPTMVHEVMVGLMANARQPLAHTKNRGDVSGGGKKPWKQKGTGRARHGSIRSPIWVGGGITFGPRSERDYTKKINKKVKQKAFLMSLSDKTADERLVLLETLESKNGKTKDFAALIGKLPVKGKLTVVTPGKDEKLSRSARNLKKIHLVGAGHIGLMDVLKSDFIIMSSATVDKLESMYAKSPSGRSAAGGK